jgi:hypothetical protein
MFQVLKSPRDTEMDPGSLISPRTSIDLNFDFQTSRSPLLWWLISNLGADSLAALKNKPK